MERGSYTLDDGTRVEAGWFETDKTGSFGSVAFKRAFQVPPVVLAGVMKNPPKQDPQRLRTSHPGGSPASQAAAKPVRTATVRSEP